ncbi:MAG: alcohol dehydrogenase, partial [Candidatus Brocadiia bacterium]
MPREVRGVAPGELDITEYRLPELAEGHVRVRTEFATAKHGTEMAFYKGYGSARGRYDADLGVFVERDEEPTF